MIAAAGALLLSAHPAAAQADERAVSVWSALGKASVGDSDLTTSYQPQLLFGESLGGSAGQQAMFGSGFDTTWEAGLDVFVSRYVGLEAWIGREDGDASVTSGPYRTSLRYVTRPPPDYVERTFDYSASAEWGLVTRSYERQTVAANVVARWGAARVGGTVSGGLAFVRTSATFDPLGYSTFVLGGHSTLFANEYRLAVEVAPETDVRANAGATLDIRLGTHAALMTGIRAVLGADRTASLRVVSIDRSAGGFEPPSASEITDRLAESRVTMPTRTIRLLAGLKLYF